MLNRQKYERGQSLVEFTFVAIFLLILLAGIVDLGRAFFVRIAILDAAAEGAAYAALDPGCQTDTGGRCTDPNNVTYRVRHASESALVDWNLVTVTVDEPPVIVSGAPITVVVHYDFELILPVISDIVGGNTMPIGARATQVIW